MWELYDRLIGEIPPDIKVKRIVIGRKWTLVENSEDSLGLAMTTEGRTIAERWDARPGMALARLAEAVKSWNFIEAGVGMAAINSYYNTKRRMEALGCEKRDAEFCTFGLDLKDKKVAMIGHLRHSGEEFEDAKSLSIIERSPQEGDYPDSSCEFILPDSDIVIITGSALINKTMPRLLELSKNAFTVIAGPSVPMSPGILPYGVDRLEGFLPLDRGMIEYIEAGTVCSPYCYGQRFSLESMNAYEQNR